MVTLHYQISYNDYVEACRVANSDQPDSFRVLRIVGYAGCCFGFLLLVKRLDGGGWVAPLALILLSLYVLIMPYWRAYSSLQCYWREGERHLQPTDLEADEGSLRCTTPLYNVEYHWPAFSHFRETRNLFLLYFDRVQMGHLIPKRAFQDEERLQEFRRLLEQMLAETRPGFPVLVTSRERQTP